MQNADFGVVDISDEQHSSALESKADDRKENASSELCIASLEPLINQILPVIEVTENKGTDVKVECEALGSTGITESECTSDVVDEKILRPVGIEIPFCPQGALTGQNVVGVESFDVKATSFAGEAFEVCAASVIEAALGSSIAEDFVCDEASDEFQCSVTDVETVPKEPQLDGHLGLILAESFANASAPEQIESTEAVVGESVPLQASTSHSTVPKSISKIAYVLCIHIFIYIFIELF